MKKNLEAKLKKINVVIVAHIFASGPALDLEQFLKEKVSSLIFIGHPFAYRKEVNSFYRIYSKGKKIKEKKAIGIKLPGIFMYLKDSFLTFWWVFRYQKRISLYIGSDGFSAYLGLLLKKLGKVQEVVLYTIDFMPKRFESVFLNWLYHFFDKQCLKKCKVIWNLSDKMAEGREDYMKIKREVFAPQITIPLGIWDKRIPKLGFAKKKRYQVVFMGHILKKQGLDIVIDAFPTILKQIPQANLLIIGTGDYENNLKKKVKKLKLEKSVNFVGYIESHEQVEKMLSESILAVATYKPDPESFTYFADPGKIKNYLSAGLPVILTDVPPIAREIEEKKCAQITEYTPDSFAKHAIGLLSSPAKLQLYQMNAFKFAKNFDWENVFTKALKQTLL